MQLLKTLLISLSLIGLVACGSDEKKKPATNKSKTDGSGVLNDNSGARSGDEIASSTGAATYFSPNGSYNATLTRNGSTYAVSVERTSIQNLILEPTSGGSYIGTMPGVVTPVLDELILSKVGNDCTVVWKEYGYGTADRIFNGPCP